MHALKHAHTHSQNDFLDGEYNCGNDEMNNVSTSYADYFKHWYSNFERTYDKTNKIACASSEDSDEPGHPPSLISLRCPNGKKSWGPELPTERTAKALIRLGGCPGWSESSLGAHAILLVLPWAGSFFHFTLQVPMFHFSLHRCNKYDVYVWMHVWSEKYANRCLK